MRIGPMCILLTIALLLSSPPSSADHKHTPVEGGYLSGWACSTHDGDHPEVTGGRDSAFVFCTNMPASEVETWSGGNPNIPVYLKQKTEVSWETPFTKAKADTARGGHYITVAYTYKDWGDRRVRDSDGDYWATYGGSIEIAEQPPAHGPEKSTVPAATPTTPTVAVFYEGGTASMVEVSPGFWSVETDIDGNVVWLAEPEIALRFTSSIDPPAGGLRTFRYLIENLTDEDRTFAFREVTSSEYPNGWSGTVAANDTEAMELSVSDQQTVYSQFTDATIASASFPEEVSQRPVVHYVPASRVTYGGANQITSAVFDQSTGCNRVSFTVSGPAAKACLYRKDPLGVHLVLDVPGAYVPGPTYTLIDDSFGPWENLYWIETGIRSNSSATPIGDEVEIDNR
jgi:hypothetical protein